MFKKFRDMLQPQPLYATSKGYYLYFRTEAGYIIPHLDYGIDTDDISVLAKPRVPIIIYEMK